MDKNEAGHLRDALHHFRIIHKTSIYHLLFTIYYYPANLSADSLEPPTTVLNLF